MIDLTRLNGHRLLVNCDLIKFAEATPDTTLTLITGEKLIVRESTDHLLELVAAWRGRVLSLSAQSAAQALNAKVSHDAAIDSAVDGTP